MPYISDNGKKVFLFLPIFSLMLLSNALFAADSIQVLFVYGSKPKVKSEDKWFGGLHGGHVSLSYKGQFISFLPEGDFHVFKKKTFHSRFVWEKNGHFVFDTSGSRYLLLSIPISSSQRLLYDSVIGERLKSAPYDYAFFGMRCASAAYEILASSGIYPKITKKKMWRRFFYPKRLRMYCLKKSKRNHHVIIYRSGNTNRKWEKT